MTIWHDNTEAPNCEAECFIIYEHPICYWRLMLIAGIWKENDHGIKAFIPEMKSQSIRLNYVLKWCYKSALIDSAFKKPVGYVLKNSNCPDDYWEGSDACTSDIYVDMHKRNIESMAKDNTVYTEVVALYD